MKSFLKHRINKTLKHYGHTIAHAGVVPSFDRFVNHLEQAELTPKTVFDVGVAYGTPWLYSAFPSAHFHLIDPTRESLIHMQAWARKLNAEIHSVGLGEAESIATINVRPEIGGSSLYEDVETVAICSTYEVPIVRFDRVFTEFVRPALCKIDVQGAELSVLHGMGDRLAELDALIVETSLIATLKGNAPEFADITEFFSKRGFCLFDIVGMIRRPLDQALAQIDAVFVPETSALRRDRRWGQTSRN